MSLAQAFEGYVEQFEQDLISSKRKFAEQRRQQDANQVFCDIPAPGPEPISTLVHSTEARVTSIESEDSFCFAPNHAFDPAVPLSHAKGHCHIVECDEGQAWVDGPMPSVGDLIRQQCFVGSLQELHAEFEHAWAQRWCKHDDLDPGHWQQVDSTISALFQPLPHNHLVITVDMFRAFVRSRKPRSAVGIDGMGRSDLLSMPDSGVIQLLSIYHKAEQTGIWPIQLRHGVVHSLQKTAQAATIHDYRPITIYPFPYRIWSSLQSKHVLQFISTHAPPGLQGNRIGASTIAIWWKNQAMIETLMFDGAPAQGYVLDLTKAFNTLPREPVFRAAVHIGIEGTLLKAWMGFVATNTRHFCVRRALSDGIQGSRGFPEGCGLSVVAMAIIDWIVDRWFHCLWPQVSFTSYVDKWELESSSVDALTSSLPALQAICVSLDLELDHNKTFGWALIPDHRAALRESGCPTQLDGRNLGGHMHYSHRRTNYTVTAKCQQLETLWGRLARSPATAPQKLRAARCCAWPRALHGIATISLGPKHFESMRAGLFQALRFRNKGAQPQLQFMMEKPNTDPEYFALEQTAVAFRKFCDPDQQSPIFAVINEQLQSKHIPGPCGVLQS